MGRSLRTTRAIAPERLGIANVLVHGTWLFLGSTCIMALGAYLAFTTHVAAADPGGAVARLFGSARLLAQCLIVAGVVYGNVMNLYSAYMSTSTIFSGMRRMSKISIGRKLAIMATLMSISAAISMLAQDNFQAYFADILSAMIYLLVPWSAINLADYYIVRRGQYNVVDMFRIDGVYGRYRWKTIGVYVLGISIQEPFMSFSFYKGSLTQWIGADVAWLPGLLVPGLLHVLVERRSRKSAPASCVKPMRCAASEPR
jgi:nucleobase:cation symporter-1, NCS1 family